MESDLGVALQAVRKSNHWSLINAVVIAVNKKLKSTSNVPVSVVMLTDFLASFDAKDLQSHVIWVQSLGANPIVCVNPTFVKAAQKHRLSDEPEALVQCSFCVGGNTSAVANARYFGSHDYNAGRHAATNSRHKANCLLWRPPESGHLHSWRRGHDI